MNIYLLSQSKTTGYDTYDSAVVISNSEEEARNIHPDTFCNESNFSEEKWSGNDWCRPEDVDVICLGKADERYVSAVVICSSFNAG